MAVGVVLACGMVAALVGSAAVDRGSRARFSDPHPGIACHSSLSRRHWTDRQLWRRSEHEPSSNPTREPQRAQDHDPRRSRAVTAGAVRRVSISWVSMPRRRDTGRGCGVDRDIRAACRDHGVGVPPSCADRHRPRGAIARVLGQARPVIVRRRRIVTRRA